MNALFTNMSVSVRQYLAWPLVAILLLVGVTASWILVENSQHVRHQIERQMALSLNAKVNQHLDQLFAEPVRAVNTAHQLYHAGRISAAQPIERARVLAAVMATTPELSALNFGFEDGSQFGVTRNLSDSALDAAIMTLASKPYRDVYALQDTNQPDQFLFEDTANYIPNAEPFYRNVVKSGKADWYPLYQFPNGELADISGNFGISYALPEFDDQHHLVGVISADLALGQISRHLRSLPLVDGDQVFVLDERNQIVGISNDVALVQRDVQRQDDTGRIQPQLVRFDNIASPLIRAVGQYVVKQSPGSSLLTVQGASYAEDLRDFQSGSGLRLRSVVLVPDSRFAGIARTELRSTLYQLWIAIGVGIALALALAVRLGRPIAQLNEWTQQLSQGNPDVLNHVAKANNVANTIQATRFQSIKELRQLGESVASMAVNLHKTVTTLEERVAERTAELEQVNSNLFELSNTDGLTGIPNRRKFDEVLHSEWNRATRSGQPLALALIDVDWFKKYNDHYGHLAGDDCLRNMASVLKSKIRRSSDLVARYGGEEFAIISPGINKINASEMANLICSAVAEASLPHAMSPFGKVTVSIGVAMIIPAIDVAPETLIKAADEALYHAKDQGRNQVISAEIEIASKEKYAGSEFRFEQY